MLFEVIGSLDRDYISLLNLRRRPAIRHLANRSPPARLSTLAAVFCLRVTDLPAVDRDAQPVSSVVKVAAFGNVNRG